MKKKQKVETSHMLKMYAPVLTEMRLFKVICEKLDFKVKELNLAKDLGELIEMGYILRKSQPETWRLLC